jgi:hypothetical protein
MDKTLEARIKNLASDRLAQHRLEPSRPIRDAREAADFVRERRIVMTVGTSSLAALPASIAGRPLSGSWMAQPECREVHEMLQSLSNDRFPGVRLVSGKLVLINPELGPAVQRLATDPGRRAAALAKLTPTAARLLKRVEADGEVRMDSLNLPTKEGRDARVLLESRLLVVSESLHSSQGYHTAVVRPWRGSSIARSFAAGARGMDLETACDHLVKACLHSAVLAPDREARRWFPFAGERIEALSAAGHIEKLRASKTIWLTLRSVRKRAGSA